MEPSFADVIVHRLLAASLGIDKLPPVFQDRSQLTSIADSKCFFFSFHNVFRASMDLGTNFTYL